MDEYSINWITENIGTGRAPMSYEDLDIIKGFGIDAIINLCGEFSDLHEIEEKAGFEVFWLPIEDEKAPGIEEMEEGLAWLDELLYLGKKVLIHCKHGIGRTGTFVTAYMLRRGFVLRKAEKLLKKSPAAPSNYSQWSLLRKYGKREGKLTISEPTATNRKRVDLSYYFNRYKELIERAEKIAPVAGNNKCTQKREGPGQGVTPIEAVYLGEKLDAYLSHHKRKDLKAKVVPKVSGDHEVCQLNEGGNCLAGDERPFFCRLNNGDGKNEEISALYQELALLSQELFGFLFDYDAATPLPLVNINEVVSGKFIQLYFDFLITNDITNISNGG